MGPLWNLCRWSCRLTKPRSKLQFPFPDFEDFTDDGGNSLTTGTAVRIQGQWQNSPAGKEQSHEVLANEVDVIGGQITDSTVRTFTVLLQMETTSDGGYGSTNQRSGDTNRHIPSRRNITLRSTSAPSNISDHGLPSMH